MKQLVSLLFSILLCYSNLFAQSTPAPFKNFGALQQYFSRSYKHKQPLIMAHRGGTGKGLPENSKASFQHTYAKVPSALLELDVQMTKDSTLVIFHDDSVNTKTNGTGLLKNMTLQQARALQMKDPEGTLTNEHIPTFKEVLDWNKNRAILIVDIKPGTPIEKVISHIIKAKAANNVVLILYSIEDAQMVYQKHKNFMLAVGFNDEARIEKIKNSGIPNDHLLALTSKKGEAKSFYDKIHEMGILCSREELASYPQEPTERKEELYKEMWQKGADIIVTYDPEYVWNVFH